MLTEEQIEEIHNYPFQLPGTYNQGNTFGKYYKVLKFLGKGSFSSVYSVQDKETQQNIAMKIIDKDKISKTSYQLLRKEADLLKNLNHENVIKMEYSIENQDFMFIAMKLIQGKTLEQFIKDKKEKNEQVTEDDSVSIIKEILHAIQYLHSQDIIHRDLKPENILIVENKNCQENMIKQDNENNSHETQNTDEQINSKSQQSFETITNDQESKKPQENTKLQKKYNITLIDFGLSLKTEFIGSQNHEVCGTLLYQSPELANENVYDNTVDIWSLGIIQYMIFSMGVHPLWDQKQDTKKDFKLKLQDPQWVFPENMGKKAKDFFSKCCAKKSFNRMSAKKALTHNWITGEENNCEHFTLEGKLKIFGHLKEFSKLFKTIAVLQALKQKCKEQKLTITTNYYIVNPQQEMQETSHNESKQYQDMENISLDRSNLIPSEFNNNEDDFYKTNKSNKFNYNSNPNPNKNYHKNGRKIYAASNNSNSSTTKKSHINLNNKNQKHIISKFGNNQIQQSKKSSLFISHDDDAISQNTQISIGSHNKQQHPLQKNQMKNNYKSIKKNQIFSHQQSPYKSPSTNIENKDCIRNLQQSSVYSQYSDMEFFDRQQTQTQSLFHSNNQNSAFNDQGISPLKGKTDFEIYNERKLQKSNSNIDQFSSSNDELSTPTSIKYHKGQGRLQSPTKLAQKGYEMKMNNKAKQKRILDLNNSNIENQQDVNNTNDSNIQLKKISSPQIQRNLNNSIQKNQIQRQDSIKKNQFQIKQLKYQQSAQITRKQYTNNQDNSPLKKNQQINSNYQQQINQKNTILMNSPNQNIKSNNISQTNFNIKKNNSQTIRMNQTQKSQQFGQQYKQSPQKREDIANQTQSSFFNSNINRRQQSQQNINGNIFQNTKSQFYNKKNNLNIKESQNMYYKIETNPKKQSKIIQPLSAKSRGNSSCNNQKKIILPPIIQK